MTADGPTETGPVPAPESTHAPELVWRDRGAIIANLTARVAELELACQRLRDDTQGAHAERDQARAEAERLLAGKRRATAVAQEWALRATNAEAETAALRAQVERLAERVAMTRPGEPRYMHEARNVIAIEIRAALAGAPAVTPTETQAEGRACDFCVGIHPGILDHCLNLPGCRPAPVADPTTGETR